MKKVAIGVCGVLFLALYVYYILTMVKMYNLPEKSVDIDYEIMDNYTQSSRLLVDQIVDETIKLAKEKADEEIKEQLLLEKEKREQQVTVSRKTEDNIAYQSYFEVTFYTAGYESTGKRKGDKGYGITASGTTVQENRTAACPKSMEFGTKVYIEGFGYRVCEDRGSAITNAKLDVYVESLDEALQLGRQTLLVKVLN